MLGVLNKTKEFILDILLPKACVGCGKEGKYICENCEVFLSETPNNINNLISIWEYEGLMEKLICDIKYEGKYHIIDELVEKAFGIITKDTSRFKQFLAFLLSNIHITYVPMYKKKEKERGFNQAELIAKKIGEIIKKEPLPLLVKIKDNLSQVGLSPGERIENVKDVFEYCPMWDTRFPTYLQNVVLVDDVYTTGATAKECVRVLRKAGVKNVLVFTLARKLSI